MKKHDYDNLMAEIEAMCKGLMAGKQRSNSGFRQDTYENDYDRREGRTMPITAFDKDLLFYD